MLFLRMGGLNFQYRTGLSTIITSAMMLSAVTIMGTILVSWSNTSLFSHQQTIESSYSTKINEINEKIIIENVWFGQIPTKFVNITMSNAGSIGLNVTKIKLTTATSSNEFQFTNLGMLPNKSSSTKISYDWSNGIPVDITVTTGRNIVYKTEVIP